MSIWRKSRGRCIEPPRWRYAGDRAFQDLEEGLFHAFRSESHKRSRIVRLAGDLADLVDVDDARLGLLPSKSAAWMLEEDVLHAPRRRIPPRSGRLRQLAKGS